MDNSSAAIEVAIRQEVSGQRLSLYEIERLWSQLVNRSISTISLLIALTITAPILALADPQQELTTPPKGQTSGSSFPQANQAIQVPPSPNNQILELPPLINGALQSQQPLANPEIPSPFIGCWEGTVERWDSEDGNFQGIIISGPGRIVFCYRQNHIDVPVAELEAEFGTPSWFKQILSQVGLSLAFVKVDHHDIFNTIYAITPTQIYARTFVPLEMIGFWRWLLPVPKRVVLVDEELAQKKDLDHLSVQARQELEVDGLPGVRTWHADFHRTVDPNSRFVAASGTGVSL